MITAIRVRSRITDKILSIVKEWQERPLEEICAVVFMDGCICPSFIQYLSINRHFNLCSRRNIIKKKDFR